MAQLLFCIAKQLNREGKNRELERTQKGVGSEEVEVSRSGERQAGLLHDCCTGSFISRPSFRSSHAFACLLIGSRCLSMLWYSSTSWALSGPVGLLFKAFELVSQLRFTIQTSDVDFLFFFA